MKHVSILSSLAAGLSVTRAAPANARQAAPASISTQCTNTEIRSNWLIGDCLTGADSTTRIKSAVFLSNKLENDDGDLKWKADGNYFRSCSDCAVAAGSLSCQCSTTWHSEKGSGKVVGKVNLEDHISVYNGHLLSNLAGAPQIPSSPSAAPIPSSFTYSFGGNVTCPDADGPGTGDFCKTSSTINQCKSSSPTDRSQLPWTFDGPLNCFVPFIYFPQYHYQFESFKLAGEGAWEMVGYADENCSGEPITKVEQDDMGTCQTMATRVKAISVRPAFNGDAR